MIVADRVASPPPLNTKRRNEMDNAEAIVKDLIPFLGGIAAMLDEMKTERTNGNGLPWTAWNQEQRVQLTIMLSRAHAVQP